MAQTKNYNINATSIGQVGDIENIYYGAGELDLRAIHALLGELKTLQSSSSLPPTQKQGLKGAVDQVEAALTDPNLDKNSLKAKFTALSPGLKSLLSSISANLASDALVAGLSHAVKNLDKILQSLS